MCTPGGYQPALKLLSWFITVDESNRLLIFTNVIEQALWTKCLEMQLKSPALEVSHNSVVI
jgi:hypothetical protein